MITSYANRNRIKKNMNRLQRRDGTTTTTDPTEILDVQTKFYKSYSMLKKLRKTEKKLLNI